MKLLIVIVPKKLCPEVIKITGGGIIDFQTVTPGVGTAPSEVLEFLSLGETEKDVIFSVVDDHDIPSIFNKLVEELDFLDHGKGVAFSIPLDGISKQAYKHLYQE